MRNLLIGLLLPFALAALIGTIVLWPSGDATPSRATQIPVDGTVTAVSLGGCTAGGTGGGRCRNVEVQLDEGAAEGRTITKVVPIEPSTPTFTAGDAVVLSYSGAAADQASSYQLVDFQRGVPLTVLALAFALAVFALGRWRGLAALGALVLSFVVIVLFMLPAILAGENPLAVGVVGAGLIMFVVLYLTHGFSARTSTAVLGTMTSLALIGVLGALFSGMADLTGLDDETQNLIGSLGHGLDTRGLLLAGVVIGALGILDDVTVTQTSAVWELRRANPELAFTDLYAAGIRIGRDHIASSVNTLFMAYAGAALPVLLYSSISGAGLGAIMSSQSIAEEIVRALVGSIGLIAAVPVTTALAAAVAIREPAGDEA